MRTAAVATAVTATVVAAGRSTVSDFVTAQAQSLFSSLANPFVAIAQRAHQSARNLAVAAAGILLQFGMNVGGGGEANSFVAVVQAVDKRTHDFRVAAAVVALSETVQGIATILGIAGGLRAVDHVRDIAGIADAAAV